ncbi:MAG: hypothetical protein AAGB48_02750 [Planctomycetota bacterium]
MMMPRSIAVPAVLALLGAGAAQAQLRPVEAGIEDVSPIGTSERIQPLDARDPIGFERVYEISRPDGTRSFVRVSGALYAEFDHAWYNPLGEAVVPAGTRFTIGRPPADLAAPSEPAPRLAPNAVSLRAEPGRPTGEPRPSDRPVFSVGEPSIVDNELYRRIRITELLQATLNRSDLKPIAVLPQEG